MTRRPGERSRRPGPPTAASRPGVACVQTRSALPSLDGVPLSFSEEPGAGLVAVTLTEAGGDIVESRVVSADDLPRIVARARALVDRGDAGAFVTLDELIDGRPHPEDG